MITLTRYFVITLCLLCCLSVEAQVRRQRIVVSTDIGGTDPDDNQSMIHLLMYANEFEIEGLVSSPSFGDGNKEEILRMIDEYEQDLPKLQCGLKKTFGNTRGEYPSPDYLRSVTKQGRKGAAPLCGYSEPTEGSEWIVRCARQSSGTSKEVQGQPPLWILVWGALEDVAQALHDAPDIADKIRIYWIGGPNKKWGCNAYNYIVENFPHLWFIENNATYRGFIGSAKDQSVYQAAYWETFMKDAGVMGADFRNYYDGIVKMGDTPSLLYLMNGDVDMAESDHWGGRFEKMPLSPKYVVSGKLAEEDTVPVYSLMEWRLRGPDTGIASDSVCFTLHIDRQDWKGHHVGNGIYVVRYAPKAPATLDYSITSPLPGFPSHEGVFTVSEKWPEADGFCNGSGNIVYAPYKLGGTWFTDCREYSLSWQGAATIACWREEILKDWAQRFAWMR